MTVRAKDQVTLAVLPAPSYVRTYYLLQASGLAAPAKPTTNPPASPWTTTEPSYTDGSTNTLYTVMVTAYGSVAFEYGDVQKSSSYEAAKAAYNKAVAAQSAATNALTVANGKVSLGGLGVTNPPTAGHSEGDLIFLRNGAGKVNGIRIMNASNQWVSYTILADQVLVPGSIGTISLADNTVTAPKVVASEALLTKLLVRAITAAEIDVQSLIVSELLKTTGYDAGEGVLINNSGMTVVDEYGTVIVAPGGLSASPTDGTAATLIGTDGILRATGAELTDGTVTISDTTAEVQLSTHDFETNTNNWVIGTRSTAAKRSGSYGLSLPPADTDPALRVAAWSTTQSMLSLAWWRMDGWIKIPDGATGVAEIRVRRFDTGGTNQLVSITPHIIESGGTWIQVASPTIAYQPNTLRYDVAVSVTITSGPTTYAYMDDFRTFGSTAATSLTLGRLNGRLGLHWRVPGGDTERAHVSTHPTDPDRLDAAANGQIRLTAPIVRVNSGLDLAALPTTSQIRTAVLGGTWQAAGGTVPSGIIWDRPLRYRLEGPAVRWEGRPYPSSGEWSLGTTGDLVVNGLPVSLLPSVPTPLVTASDLGVEDTPSAVLWPDGSIRVYGGAYGSEAWPWLGGTSALPGSAY